MTQLQNKKLKKVLSIIGIVILSIIVLLAVAYLILMAVGKNQLLGEKKSVNAPEGVVAEIDTDENTTVYNGQKYILNKDVASILFIGIDNKDFSESGEFGESGQADALYLMAIDTKTGKVSIINISRDTMTDIDTYSLEGKYLGLERQQICLAYSYGDGKKQSCENTLNAVSSLLCGIDINSYFTVDFKAVPILNDVVGGVTVTANESCSENGFSFTEGETLTLLGNDALRYLRARNKSTNSNSLRMERQMNYLKAFFAKFWKMTKKDIKLPLTLYNKLSKYSINDINASKITYLTSCVIENKDDYSVEFKNIKGEYKQGEKYAEFYPDNTSLFETVLDVFYEKAE